MQSRKQKVAINIFSASSVMLLNSILAFASRIVFLRVLNESYLGISSLFTNVIGVLSLADLGIVTAMMYSMYQPIAENDTEKIKSLVAYFKKIYLVIAASVFTIGVVLIPFLPYIINLEEEIPYINVYYMLSLLGTVVTYLFVYRNTLISADQKGYIINNITMVSRLVIFIVNIIVLITTKNYILYLTANFILSLLTNFIINGKAMKMYPYLRQKAKPLGKQEKADIAENVKSLFIYKLSGTIVSNTDNILTSILVSTVMVGFYSNYVMIVAHITSLVSLVFTQVKASVGNKLAVDKTNYPEQQKLFFVLEFVGFWVVGFSAIAFFVLLGDFVILAFGEHYALSTAVVGIIVVNFYVTNIRKSVDTFRQAMGVFKKTQSIAITNALLNLGLSIVLGVKLGLFGILLATTLSHFLYDFWKMPSIMFHQYFKMSSKAYFVNYVAKAVLTVFAGAVTYSIAQVPVFENAFLVFGLKMIVCAIVPNIIFFLFTFKTKEFVYLKTAVLLPAFQKAKKKISG